MIREEGKRELIKGCRLKTLNYEFAMKNFSECYLDWIYNPFSHSGDIPEEYIISLVLSSSEATFYEVEMTG